jgi:hypothetical protein
VTRAIASAVHRHTADAARGIHGTLQPSASTRRTASWLLASSTTTLPGTTFPSGLDGNSGPQIPRSSLGPVRPWRPVPHPVPVRPWEASGGGGAPRRAAFHPPGAALRARGHRHVYQFRHGDDSDFQGRQGIGRGRVSRGQAGTRGIEHDRLGEQRRGGAVGKIQVAPATCAEPRRQPRTGKVPQAPRSRVASEPTLRRCYRSDG